MWTDYFQRIVVLNLAHRKDRLERTTEIMNEYGIEFEVYQAIEYEPGFMGLVMTMQKLFNECLLQGVERLLIFEDDVEFCHRPDVTSDTMDKCVSWLKDNNWNIFYMGTMHTGTFGQFVTPHILPVTQGYSTHAVAYGKQAMKYIVERVIHEPIDNFLVKMYQPQNGCFAAYPLLATQRQGYSDIGKSQCDWNFYITTKYEESVMRIKNRRTQF